jgi:Glycosyl transferase family 2
MDGLPGPIDGAGPTAEPTGARPMVGLVVSTRNAAVHIGPFVERVEAALAPFPLDCRVELIDVDPKHGDPGGAVRSGLARVDGGVVCVIDADLQHPPEVLPELLAPILLGRADVCVGSRYRPGGSAAGLDGRWRRLAARASAALLRWLFPATQLTTDPGSGLFAMRREVLDSVALRARGSWVLAEILVRGDWHTLCDVPYRFESTDHSGVHLGAAATFGLAGELVSLLRFDPRGVAARRRVAPVHVELLRGPAEAASDPARTVRFGRAA